MKIVVFGPGRRTGALRDGMVVDLCGAFAKYAAEKPGDTVEIRSPAIGSLSASIVSSKSGA